MYLCVIGPIHYIHSKRHSKHEWKPYGTKRERNRETKREGYMCKTNREGNRETKKDNYIYCDVTNVVAYLKNHIYYPKRDNTDQISSVQFSAIQLSS